MKFEVITHEKSDERWVSAWQRRCSGICNSVKPISDFRPKGVKGDEPGLPQVTTLCHGCQALEEQSNREVDATRKLAKATDSIAKTGAMLAGVLANSTKRRMLSEASIEPADVLRQFVTAAGGPERLHEVIGKTLFKVVETGKPETQIKAIGTYLHFVASTKKAEGEPIDMSAMTDEDLFAICLEPARHLALTNEEFRRQLLNEPEVREMFMRDAGYEMVEVGEDGSCDSSDMEDRR